MNRYFQFQPRNFRHVTIDGEGLAPAVTLRPHTRCEIGIATGIALSTTLGVSALAGGLAGLSVVSGVVGLAATGMNLANGQPTNSPSQINNGIGAQYAPGVYQEYLESVNRPLTPSNVHPASVLENEYGDGSGSLYDQATNMAALENIVPPTSANQAYDEANGINPAILSPQATAALAAAGNTSAQAQLANANATQTEIVTVPGTSSGLDYETIGIICGVIALGAAILSHHKK